MPRLIGWDGPTGPYALIGDELLPMTHETAIALAQGATLLSLSPDQAEALLAEAERRDMAGDGGGQQPAAMPRPLPPPQSR